MYSFLIDELVFLGYPITVPQLFYIRF